MGMYVPSVDGVSNGLISSMNRQHQLDGNINHYRTAHARIASTKETHKEHNSNT